VTAAGTSRRVVAEELLEKEARRREEDEAMIPNRAVGYLRPPTLSQVARYAARHSLHPTPEELTQLLTSVSLSLEGYDRVEELEASPPALRHHRRDPGRPPRPDEDPYNAFIRFCEVRGAQDGPLAGRTVGVKDCIAVAGVPMTNGGRRTPAAVPTEDAVVVERLLDAGAAITGKTNLDDLAYGEGSAFGEARNPVNPRYSTGGSSSGSAASVAAGMVDMALGADEGGSIRIPSAWCGLVGMKATHGLVPTYGMTYMDHTIDHIGPMTKTVEDNARMLEVIAGSDWRDPQWVRGSVSPGEYARAAQAGISGLRVGVIPDALEPSGCTPDVLSAFEQAVSTLSGLGATIGENATVPLWSDVLAIGMPTLNLGVYGMAITHGVGFGHLGRVDPAVTAAWAAQNQLQGDDLPSMIKSGLVLTEYLLDHYQAVPFAKAQNLRLELRRQVMAALAGFDVLVTPTTARVAIEVMDRRAEPGEMAARVLQANIAANTMQLDLSGHPALTVPCGTGEHDLPVGLQIIGPHFAEERCYEVGFAFESAFG
jgi:amidase